MLILTQDHRVKTIKKDSIANYCSNVKYYQFNIKQDNNIIIVVIKKNKCLFKSNINWFDSHTFDVWNYFFSYIFSDNIIIFFPLKLTKKRKKILRSTEISILSETTFLISRTNSMCRSGNENKFGICRRIIWRAFLFAHNQY